MKILAIRGRNLTSFSGEFALELDRAPLDRLGLFAITGATGSGKSTLLDAMCLALFDQTPRLGGGIGAKVGRADEEEDARLAAYDVRGMLRRGAGEGHAEVDFLGKDGRRYRARWSVWRARNKAEGRFRPQEMSLTDVVSGQLHGRTKGEVLAAIQERLGLSFDQFRRSALLAQGEFAAFLRANANERAELLERMTGTEVYSRLSIAAHEKNRTEQEELAKRAQGLAAISLLSEEERTAAEGRLAAEASARGEAEARLKEAEAAASWHAALAGLRSGEREAEQKLSDATEALAASAPRVAYWEQVRAAEPLREVVVAEESARRRVGEAEVAREGRAREAEAARAAVSTRQSVLASAEAARASARAEEEAARPVLEEAARLDTRLAEAARESRDAARRVEEARAEVVKARAELEAVQAREAAARAAGDGARTWLTEKAHWEVLAREWPRWQRELERFESARKEEQQARDEAGRLRVEVDRRKEDVALRRREWQSAVEAEETARATASQADAAVGPEAGAERRAAREALLTRRDVLKTLDGAWKGARAAGASVKEAREDARLAREAVEAASGEMREASSRRVACDAALREAQRSLALAKATQGHAALRAELREGEPCPLCGAKEHPYRRETTALEGLVAESSGRVDALEAERDGLARAELESGARRASAEAREAQAKAREKEATGQREEHRSAWSAAGARWRASALPSEMLSSLPGDVEAPEVEAWLTATHQDVRERLAAVLAEEEAAETLLRAAREAREALEARRTRREASAEALRRAEEFFSQSEHGLRELVAKADSAASAWRQVRVEVAPVFALDEGWEAKLEKDPSLFRSRCGDRVSLWRTKTEALQAAEARVAEEQRHRAKAEAQVEGRERESEAHARLATLKETELGDLGRSRAALLEGRSTDEARAAFQARRAAADTDYERARSDSEVARRAEQVATALAEDSVRLLAEARVAHAKARTALDARLTERGTPLEAVRSLLAHDAAWTESEGRALTALREAQAHARVVLTERLERRTRHEASGPPSLGEAEAGPTCERLRADTEARRRSEATLRARLEADDAARTRHGAEAAALEARQREAEVWKALSDLIGSHDGRRFKVFAQSLTLDALLLHANAHLQELARRYRLMRVPGHDLDLQVVDGDMGDEVRSVASLSGGESFLVSLALALGLASLSSETTQVETLFIDEGFGTLDPETLEVALATLDALQATGRQVGIISHVTGMAERIGVQVRVVKQGGGRSRLVVDGDLGSVPVPEAVGQQVA